MIRLRPEQGWTCNVTLHVHTCSGCNCIISLMRRPNTNSTPNKPVKLPRNQLKNTLRGHESRPHRHDTVLRHAVKLQVSTHSNMYFNIIPPTFSKTFPSFSPKPKLFTHYSSPIRATYSAHLILLNLTIRIIFVTPLSKLSCNLLPIRLKRLPHPPIPKHHHPIFFPLYRRPNFTPIQNTGQNYSSVSLLLQSLQSSTANRKTKILGPTVAGIL